LANSTNTFFESSVNNWYGSTFLAFGAIFILLTGFDINSSFLNDAYGQADNLPAFQDSYWTDNLSSIPGARQTKLEVGPGEGSSTLAVVLVNKARQDITSVRGALMLPEGFEAARSPINQLTNNNDSSNNSTANSTEAGSQIAGASLTTIVKAGETFTLYFDVNVLQDAKVKQYTTNLKLLYSKVLDLGNLEVDVPIQFRVPGKVILDASIDTTNSLVPGTVNQVPISIKNLGSASANGVTLSIKDISRGNISSSDSLSTSSDLSSSTVNLGSTTFDLGTIGQNSSKKINATIYPGYEGSGKVQNLNLQIAYGDAYGNRKQISSLVGLVVAPKPPESVIAIRAELDNESQSQGQTTTTAKGNDNKNALIITAGQIQDLKFVISNNSTAPASNLVMTLTSPLDTVKVVGNSKWTLSTLPAQGQQKFDTKVFASKDAVGNPMLFNLGLTYIYNGNTETDTLNLGAYVTGQFKVRAYDFNVTDIGGIPNLVANLLNEGNSLAMFTTVEMVDAPSSTNSKKLVNTLPPSQYLGDMDENSPLPVSIPLDIKNNNSAGMYPVWLKVTYQDDLRTEHSAILNGTVLYQPHVQTQTSSGGFLGSDGSSFLPAIIVIIAIIAIVGFLLLRRRRRRNRLATQLESSQSDEDLSLEADNSLAAEEMGSYDDIKRKKKEDAAGSALQK
jgi:hypothetical protein